jgi:hypothetical protein
VKSLICVIQEKKLGTEYDSKVFRSQLKEIMEGTSKLFERCKQSLLNFKEQKAKSGESIV